MHQSDLRVCLGVRYLGGMEVLSGPSPSFQKVRTLFFYILTMVLSYSLDYVVANTHAGHDLPRRPGNQEQLRIWLEEHLNQVEQRECPFRNRGGIADP
ncbi:MAG: hypothetical protein ACE5MM_00605 [Nitrospiraceae bacterium]